MRPGRALVTVIAAAPLAACSRNPSVLLDPAGPHADATARLFWYFLSVSVAVWLVVIVLLLLLLGRRRTADEAVAEPVSPEPSREHRLAWIVGGGVATTVVILTSFVGLSFAVDRKLIRFDAEPELEIEVTARQWWWEIRYPADPAGGTFITANEIHVPVGTSVKLALKSQDVIHSVWLPNLAGKRDVIPGRDAELVIEAEKPGVWRGRCAEFCGYQHAFMGLTLFAEPKEQFEAWQAAQRAPAAEPQTDEEKLGRDVFVRGPCGMCHVIRGTDAAGYSSNAPDLTHLKSRTTIGAGAAPNTKGHLGGWITDPHGIKPGVHMPTLLQQPREFQALLAYLESLK